jgi:TetR/AcrR family transcriptional repressor of mexJK operon
MMTSPLTVARPKGRASKDMALAREAELVDIAFDLFARDGYHGVSLAMIASRAHVAVRTIYTTFGGKAGLVRAMTERERKRHEAQLAQLRLPADAGGRLLALAAHLLGRVGDERMRALQILVIGHEDKSLARACHEAGPGQFLELLRSELARAQTECAIGRGASAGELADLFVGMVSGGCLAPCFSENLPLTPAQIAGRVRLFLQAAGSAV